MVSSSTYNVFHMRQLCIFFYCLASFDTVEFNRLPCPNNKMYDDAVFAGRFRYQLTMFGIRILIGLSRHPHGHIAYEIDVAKIIAAFCWISHCLYDMIRLNSIDCHVQWTRFRMIDFHWSISISIDNVWSLYIDRTISTPWYSYYIWNSYIKIITGKYRHAENDLSCRTVVTR